MRRACPTARPASEYSTTQCATRHTDVPRQDATRTPAELAPADTSSKGVLEIALTHGYPLGSELVPQPDYRPHTANDRRRYVEQVQLGAPILFFTQGSTLGIPLRDALASRFMHLDGRDDPMFADRGPSVHIRLVVSDYLLPTHSQENLTFDFSSCARALPGDPVAGLCALEQADSHQRLPESSPASNTREACTQRCKDHQAVHHRQSVHVPSFSPFAQPLAGNDGSPDGGRGGGEVACWWQTHQS